MSYLLIIVSCLVTVANGFVPLPQGPRTSVSRATARLFVVSSTVDTPPEQGEQNQPSFSPKVRPLHQNWWPVTTVNSLDKSRPNAIELLGSRLVIFWDDGESEWKCLDDKCAHRFAPLSEGRVLPAKGSSFKSACLQCAYHGWEFNGNGSCKRVPQGTANMESKVAPVPSYPLRVQVGMVWVWGDSDPASHSKAESLQLPINSLLRRHHEFHGDNACFMRDLPYGMELLGENLLDLSHLPFSHHSVGGLARETGGPLPLKMQSEKQKKEFDSWDEDYEDLPILQARLVDASDHDPVFLGIRRNMGDEAVADTAETVVGYYDPAHVRYRRIRREGQASHTELFMCPTRPGHSRVFLFNAAEMLLPPPNEGEKKPKSSLLSSIRKLKSPQAAMKALQRQLFMRMMDPSRVTNHMFSHMIFDGDGIFLHKQGNRMSESGLTFRDYETPSSADILLNAFRRYLETATKKSLAEGQAAAAEAVAPPDGTYTDRDPRSVLLDRYSSHTAHCPICGPALKKYEKRKGQWEVASTALLGAAGASSSLALTAALTAITGGGGAAVLPVRALATTALASGIGVLGASKAKSKLETKIRKLRFVDYIHADVD